MFGSARSWIPCGYRRSSELSKTSLEEEGETRQKCRLTRQSRSVKEWAIISVLKSCCGYGRRVESVKAISRIGRGTTKVQVLKGEQIFEGAAKCLISSSLDYCGYWRTVGMSKHSLKGKGLDSCPETTREKFLWREANLRLLFNETVPRFRRTFDRSKNLEDHVKSAATTVVISKSRLLFLGFNPYSGTPFLGS
jgi:hypothetical protein